MAKTTTIAGNTFLFTGKLTEFTREDAEAHVEAEGGKVLSGVSAKLNYLVVGEDAGSKLTKAEALGTVTILHEKEFLKMMNSGKPKEKLATSKKASAEEKSKLIVKKKINADVSSTKKKKVNNKLDEPLQELVFACNSSTTLCECHGMEIAIGTLTNENLEEIAIFIEEGMYLDSDYFSSWYQFDDIYHENGVFLDGSDVEDLQDKNDLSTSNFEIGEVKFNDIKLDNKSTYMCTFRNETIYNVSKGMVSGKGKKKVDCDVSTFRFLETLADINVSILKSASVNGELLERDSSNEEDSGEIYDTYQFLIIDNKIIFCATNGGGQDPFYLDDNLPTLDAAPKMKKDILNSLKKYQPKIAKGKDVEIEKAIRKVSLKGEQLKNLDDKLKSNKEVVLAAVKQSGSALDYASENLKSNKEVVLAAVKQNDGAFLYASDKLKADKEFVLAAVKQSGSALHYASENLKSNKEFVLAAVKQSGSALDYASENLKSNKEVVLAAVKQDGDALYYASENLKNDKEVVLAAVKQSGSALDDASENLKSNKEVVLAAIKNIYSAIQYASENLKNDKEVVLAAVEKNGDALDYASENLKNDKEVVLAAVKQDGSALDHASENLKSNKEVVLAAVKQSGYALHFASENLKNDKEVVLAAVKTDRDNKFAIIRGLSYAIGYASKKLQADKDVIKAAKFKK
jgi:K+-transporting ATPase c subunit